jgi:hypothetical protein
MMKIKLSMFLIILTINLAAQTNGESETLFGKGNPHLGYFISPFCQAGEIAGTTAVIPGVNAGVILNDKFYLGVVYKFIVTENTPTGELDNLYLDQRWGGLKCEYSMRPWKIVHLNFPIEAGLSHVELDLKDTYENRATMIPTDDASFAYLEPGIALEINMAKYLKLNLSACYRLVSDTDYRNLSQNDLMGINYAISIKIGLF